MITWPLSAAAHSGLFQRVFVSTDHPGISSVAYKAGADVLWRPDSLAKDSVGTQAVMADALNTIYNDMHVLKPPTYACCIYATTPLTLPLDLIYGYLALREANVPYVYTVGPDWQDAGQWYWGTVRAFLDGVSLDQARFHNMPETRVCDINTEDDWSRAEQLYANLIGSERVN